MKFLKKSSLLAFAIASTFASSVTLADNEAGWYIGGNVGQSRAHVNEATVVNNVLAPGYSATLLDENTIDGEGKVFLGYQFNRNFSVEAGYFDLGESQYNAITSPNGLLHTDMQVRGFNIDVVGYVPFTDKFSAFGRLGVTRALTQDTFTGTGAAAALAGKISDRDNFGKAGVGLQYDFTDSFAMRLEAERYVISDALYDHNNIDLFSVGVVYRFGAKPAPVPAPVVIAPPPPAPVVVAPPPPAPRFEKYTLSSTELFGFDSETLQMPQPKLDEIAAALKTDGAPTQIVIVGHTDRLGAPEYNQKLSERRANSVKNYIASKGIDPTRLQVVGKGEDEPVVQCTEKNKAALIECLKPNRRVEIDQVVVERKVSP